MKENNQHKQLLKKIRRGQRKYQEQLADLIKSVDTSDAQDPKWRAYADYDCQTCHGRGKLNMTWPVSGHPTIKVKKYQVPCDCSVKNLAKDSDEFRKPKPAWTVIRGNKKEEVYVQKI